MRRAQLGKRGRLAVGVLLLAMGCGADDTDTPPTTPRWQNAFDTQQTGWLLNVWGAPGSDTLLAVGGTPDTGTVMHFDGSAWKPRVLPEGTPEVNWVHGFADDDVFFVGNRGTILHWDGDEFVAQQSPVARDLWGVWGATNDALWAVGGNGREAGQATLLRFDGSAWSEVDLPELMKARVWALFKVWGSSAEDVYAVGQAGAVLHYDGSEWSELLTGADDDLISLWGTGPDRIVMVGGRSSARVVTWDGERFRAASLAPLPGLNGVWMGRDDSFHVAGLENTLATVQFDTLEYTEEYEDPVRNDFHAIFGDDSARLTAVGGNLRMTSGPYRGAAVQRELGDDE